MLARKWDPVSGLTHLMAMFLAVIGLVLMLYLAFQYATVWHVASFAVFGVTLIMLYAASSLYHLLPVEEKWKKILQNIDHMMIYILIAGTYSPICLVPLRGVWGFWMLGVIWGCALLGVAAHCFYKAPRWLATTLYVVMGWLIAVAFWPLVHSMPPAGVFWLVAGGIFYSVGAIIYATKWPFPNAKWFGFHEIFHLFVMAGSISHFWLMVRYILYLK